MTCFSPSNFTCMQGRDLLLQEETEFCLGIGAPLDTAECSCFYTCNTAWEWPHTSPASCHIKSHFNLLIKQEEGTLPLQQLAFSPHFHGISPKGEGRAQVAWGTSHAASRDQGKDPGYYFCLGLFLLLSGLKLYPIFPWVTHWLSMGVLHFPLRLPQTNWEDSSLRQVQCRRGGGEQHTAHNRQKGGIHTGITGRL